ncbi:MAG: hypothetical protein ACK5KT_13385 [Dysgonomonas sp.]
MNMKNIDELLEKYFEGETSIEEEKLLRNYFRQENIDEQHKIYAPLFNFFSEERKEIAIEKKRKKTPLYTWIGIAASIALLIGVRAFFYAPIENGNTTSIVYIDGKKITDINTINSEVLNSIENISNVNEDILNSQIDILDSFTE